MAQKLHILEGFPGIGVDKAERLLMKFGSLQAVFNAEIEDLLLVPGIGKRTVEGMLEILKKISGCEQYQG
ncbi:helix-hairpin-helix domain-containing protein [Algoriphagus boritolerans]|uniref:helix-hairpin-helix domain-containing protein n=1 Tax=Algoriphagus boritolerans TaxID=308111 RepID=UPI000B205F07